VSLISFGATCSTNVCGSLIKIDGRGVRLYQTVTLGAKSFPVGENGTPVKGVPRHPIVEDDVVIYAGATVLGRVTIAAGRRLGETCG
jgi:serine O-acetyltransferase